MLTGIAQALSAGGLDIVRLVPILVCMSVLVNLIGVTGLAPKISAVILEIGTTNIYLSLLIASLLPLILGTALPVVPTYLLSMSILTPALLKLGVDEVAAHLFYIYWGVLGAITPPTCEAAVVAAGIAKGKLGQDRELCHEARRGGVLSALFHGAAPGPGRRGTPRFRWRLPRSRGLWGR